MHSVLLLHDDSASVEALADMIRSIPRLKLAGWANSLAQAREMIDQSTPDLLLARLQLPDGWSTRLLDELRGPGRKGGPLLVVLAESLSDPNLMLALRQGADGYVMQGGDREAVAAALKLVLGGGSPMSAAIARHILAHYESADDAAVMPPSLSGDERTMLGLIAAGRPPHDIARALRLTEAQVRVRIRNVYRKLRFGLSAGSLQLVH